jgi:hypothetical protein
MVVGGQAGFRGGKAGGRGMSGPIRFRPADPSLGYAGEVKAARTFMCGGVGPWNNLKVRRVVCAALSEDRDAMVDRMGVDGVNQLMVEAKTNHEYLGAEAVFSLVSALKTHLNIYYNPVIFKRSPDDSDHLIPHPYYMKEGDDNGEFRLEDRPLFLLLDNEGTPASHFTLLLTDDDESVSRQKTLAPPLPQLKAPSQALAIINNSSSVMSQYRPFMEACRYQLNGVTRRGLLWPQRGNSNF